MVSMEQQVSELKETVKSLTKENTELKEARSNDRKAAAKAGLAKLIAEAGFPEKSVKLVTARLEKQFENAENTDTMKEAVASELDYIKSVGGSPVQRKNGAQTVQESGQLNEADRVKRTMKEMRMNEKEARIFLGLD